MFSGTGDDHTDTHGNGTNGSGGRGAVLILDLTTGNHEQSEDENTQGFGV